MAPIIKNNTLKSFINFKGAIGISWFSSSSGASSIPLNSSNNKYTGKRYMSSDQSHPKSEQYGTPPKFHYDAYLKSNGKPTLEVLINFVDKLINSKFSGCDKYRSNEFSQQENIEAKVFMSSPSPVKHEWKNFPYCNRTKQLLSIEAGVKFKRIEEICLNNFGPSSIVKGINKEYNKLSRKLAANSVDENRDFLDLLRDENSSWRFQPTTENEIQSFYLSLVLIPIIHAINIVYNSNIGVLQQNYLQETRKIPDLIIKDQKSGIFSIIEIMKTLPKAQIVKGLKSKDILKIQGVKQTIYSIVASNSNLGFLTSFGTTFIFEVDFDKCTSISDDSCKLSLKMKVLDHNDPYNTLKATMMYFLAKVLIHPTDDEKHKMIKRSLKSRSKFMVKSKKTQQKQCQQLRERFLIQYQNDHKDLDNSMIDVRLDFQEEKSMEQELTNMNKNVKCIKLKKRHFSANGQFDNGTGNDDNDDDEVLLKWYEPITFALTDDPIVNQEILEEQYLFEVNELKELEEKENRNNVDLSQFKLLSTGFIRIRDQDDNLIGIGNYIAMDIKKPKGNQNESTKRLPILTKPDILREAMNRLKSLHQYGIALSDIAGDNQSVIVNDGEVSILATRNYENRVPDMIKELDTEALGEMITSGRIIEL